MNDSTQPQTDSPSTPAQTADSTQLPVDEARPVAGQPSIENPQSQSENPPGPGSPIPNSKRPYVKTPARVAAARANLEKARAAPKEKVYRRTEKRLAANRANLAKAHAARHQELEEVVDRLDIAFPPLGEEVKPPAPNAPGEEPGLSPPGTTPPSQTADGVSPTSPEGESGNPPAGTPVPENDDPMVPEEGGVGRKFWVIGWPHGRQGADRQAPDYGALEKAGRALLHRRRALLNEVRREGREVMRLLTQAVEPTVAASLQDVLSLACSLMAVLAQSRVLGRMERLNERMEQLLEAFVEKRYGCEATKTVVSWRVELQRMVAYIHGLPPPDPAAAGSRARPKPKPRGQPAPGAPEPAAGARAPKPEEEPSAAPPPARPQRPQPDPAAVGPDLPDTLEEFQGLVRRAFCARSPEPEDDVLRPLLDDLAQSLWERLRVLEWTLEQEAQQLDEALDEMGNTLPENDRDLQERCWTIENLLKKHPSTEEELQGFTESVRQRLGIVLRQRYGPDPQIDRFCLGVDGSSPPGDGVIG